MSRLRDWFGGRAQSGLRRVSIERARATGPARRRRPIAQAGEKILAAAAAALALSVLLGVGADLTPAGWFGLFALVCLAVVLFESYLIDFRRAALASLSRVVALAALLVGVLGCVRAFDELVGLDQAAFLPLAFASLVMALVWGRARALECTVFASVLIGLYAYLHQPGAQGAGGLVVAATGAFVAALGAAEVKRRQTLVRLGLVIGLTQAATAGAFLLMDQADGVGSEVIGTLVLLGLEGLVIGFLVSGCLPIIEDLFGVTTDISLLELGNTHEHPLLRKLLLEAPGTFHHSYIVGLLAEASAEAIGGNALLARVGALFHDVGKLNKPEYFAENSTEARGRHRDLTPEMSMLIISAHTRDGVELGRYHGLPQAILNFMPEHHGTSCIEYFYNAAQTMRGAENVSEASFRYAGPKPQSVEPAIVMIADAAEAISRQMPDPNPARLREMVHEVVLKRLMDGQFEECPLTLADLARIEEASVRVLSAIYHQRPTYPKGRPHPLDLSQPRETRTPQGVGDARPVGPDRALRGDGA
ncbi:MAG: HDIG domain-containing protein [Planctomycetota bacterium]|nr:HDIG domain-containing protein [Planctomycetota bacterium]MDP6761741.1 HDIG domain-containing protein [Planctomycetota bacterium]MDP6990948.1 HDIG domain-containing protein [Planctomycetota bacterium]